ncbi:MAG TPA: GNAT family N-acetyltransferase [Candidatus Binataceae bacterium]
MNECHRIIETARLTLRPMESADIEPIHRISNEPGVRKYLFDDKAVASELIRETHQQSVTNFESRGFGIWMIREKERDEVIGFCGLRVIEDLDQVEILYALSESKWNFGYALEAARIVERYAFDRAGLGSLIGVTDRANLASWRVLEKLKMREYRPAGAREHLRYAVITRHEFQVR